MSRWDAVHHLRDTWDGCLIASDDYHVYTSLAVHGASGMDSKRML